MTLYFGMKRKNNQKRAKKAIYNNGTTLAQSSQTVRITLRLPVSVHSAVVERSESQARSLNNQIVYELSQ